MSFQQDNFTKSKLFDVILCVIAVLVIVAMVGFFISLTNLLEAENVNGEDSSDNQGSDAGGDVAEVPDKWERVDNVELLSVGDKIIIVATDYDYALGAEQTSYNRSQVCVEKSGNVVTFAEDTQIITLQEGAVAGTFALEVGNGYLYAPSSASNYLKTKSTLDENGSWLIEIDELGVASIVAQGASERNVLMYNTVNGIFSCYATSTTQKTVSIYKLIASASE
jgi:hypothetical protein